MPINTQQDEHFTIPKFSQIYDNKTILIFEIRVLVREVSQKSKFAFPCCMGSVMLFDSRAAWECDFALLQHLLSEKALFSFFQHVPNEKFKNHEILILESSCGRVGAKDAKSKSQPESHLPLADTIGAFI